VIDVSLTVNGSVRSLGVRPEATLLETLREDLGLTGAKAGCDVGDCGACTVLVDGLAVNSCLMLTAQANGREVVTVEGIGEFDELHPLQTAFERLASIQCGFCAPGVVVTAAGLVDQNPRPTRDEIREALTGNLCRCTGYTKIIDAIAEVCAEAGGGA
jgi:carbon-monoxide dehydrogenase small subunit